MIDKEENLFETPTITGKMNVRLAPSKEPVRLSKFTNPMSIELMPQVMAMQTILTIVVTTYDVAFSEPSRFFARPDSEMLIPKANIIIGNVRNRLYLNWVYRCINYTRVENELVFGPVTKENDFIGIFSQSLE